MAGWWRPLGTLLLIVSRNIYLHRQSTLSSFTDTTNGLTLSIGTSDCLCDSWEWTRVFQFASLTLTPEYNATACQHSSVVKRLAEKIPTRAYCQLRFGDSAVVEVRRKYKVTPPSAGIGARAAVYGVRRVSAALKTPPRTIQLLLENNVNCGSR